MFITKVWRENQAPLGAARAKRVSLRGAYAGPTDLEEKRCGAAFYKHLAPNGATARPAGVKYPR